MLVFTEISRKEGTLTNDRSVWPPWHVKMKGIKYPSLYDTFHLYQPMNIPCSNSTFTEKTDYKLTYHVEFSIEK